MSKRCKTYHFFFCFHPKFDTGTWNIAAAFTTLVFISAIFTLVLSFSVPKCACSEVYEHLSILPSTYQAIYVGIILYLALFILASMYAIYGTFKARSKSLPVYMILLICTEVGVFVASIYAFILITKFEEYLLLDNDTYHNIAKLVLKEDMFNSLISIAQSTSGLLKTLFKIEDGLNLDNIMNAALKDEVLVVLGGMKRMMKVSVVVLLIGINAFFITSFLVAASHYRRLKQRLISTYSGIQTKTFIHKPGQSNSFKSSAPDTMSNHSSLVSGLPLHRLPTTKSLETRSSTRTSRRTYNEANGHDNGPAKYKQAELL